MNSGRNSPELRELIEHSADPNAVHAMRDALGATDPDLWPADEHSTTTTGLIALAAASHSISRFIVTHPTRSLEVLADLDSRPAPAVPNTDDFAVAVADLVEWRGLEFLRIAARDLLGIDPLELVGSQLADLGRDVLIAAGSIAVDGHDDDIDLAVIGMGKLGGGELNYSSDIDVMFVGEGDARSLERAARRVLEIAGRCFRVDANLRPEGRNGPLVRTVDSYQSYWDRWAQPWEFQALLKAVPMAGSSELGERWWEAAQHTLWSRPVDAETLRSIRRMKERTEAEVAKKGLSQRELKRGPGGIRDIEFTAQLLQLVHGQLDDELRSPNTLTALRTLASSGYVDSADADAMTDAYRLLRTVEHRLQLVDEQQVHTLPDSAPAVEHLARVMGHTDTPEGTAGEQLLRLIIHTQATVRGIHQRVYFRPLLEAFASMTPGIASSDTDTDTEDTSLDSRAISVRLTAFGFTDALRTRAAVRDLTRGFSRSSRLMQQMLPLLLDWISTSPDPDLALLIVRNLLSGPQQMRQLVDVFRDSPAAAQSLCRLAGTSRLLGEILSHNPDLIARLPDPGALALRNHEDLSDRAVAVLELRHDPVDQQSALHRWKQRNLLGIAARDVFGTADVRTVGHDLTALADACVHAALQTLRPRIPFAVFGLGRYGGGEMAYASDLDLMFVHGTDGPGTEKEAHRIAAGLMHIIRGATPSMRVFEVDADLRPEGRNGALSRTVEMFDAYWRSNADTWERQAMSRARFIAGDAELGNTMRRSLDRFVLGGASIEDPSGRPGGGSDDRSPFPTSGLSEQERRDIRRMKARIETERIPLGEDPDFHLKLGRGSLSDIEFTAQLLQLEHGIIAPGTIEGLERLASLGAVEPTDAATLIEAFQFCERVRNRWFLVNSAPGDSLPTQPGPMLWLARSLDTTPSDLRSEYRRVTRRARAVVDRLFYGLPGQS